MKQLLLSAFFIAHTAMFAQSQTGVITGRIRSTDGRAAAGVRVALASPNANGEITSDTLAGITTTDETGRYYIDNVPPGRYGILAGAVSSPTFYPGTANGSLATILTIARGSTTAGVDFTLGTPAQTELGSIIILLKQTIFGRVVLDGPLISAFLPDLKIYFSRIMETSSSTANPVRRGLQFSNSGASVKPDGSFKLELEPAGYKISVARADSKPLEGFVLKSITLGSVDLLRERVTVNGAITGEIVITLTPVQVNRPLK